MADSSDKPTAPAVDSTPISPVRPDNARRNSLVKHLENRPERAELVESMPLLLSEYSILSPMTNVNLY